VFQSIDGRRSATERQSDPEKLLEKKFVAEVARKLEALKAKGAFDRLVVAAAPRALGYWRDAAGKNLAAAVKKELASDYAHLDETALLPLVEEAFWG
ncbi:MAG: host attachment protein, partial [Parvularculaceae bacterium]